MQIDPSTVKVKNSVLDKQIPKTKGEVKLQMIIILFQLFFFSDSIKISLKGQFEHIFIVDLRNGALYSQEKLKYSRFSDKVILIFIYCSIFLFTLEVVYFADLNV
jgi:hypothetical protein